MQIQVQVETAVSRSARARQLEAMFDVPSQERQSLSWEGEAPIEAEPWSVGLIVGPSGSGKTTVARQVFGAAFQPSLEWRERSIIDDVRADIGVADIAEAFSAVGFNTVPAWLRPYEVLSNGEKFRADVARRLLELPDPIVIDEFTSVVDRQVAQVGSHAIQKLVRRKGRKLVAVTCHYDVVDWLQPDWILEPATMTFQRRLLRRRPPVAVEIGRVGIEAWRLFAPFHYLTADLNRGAKCFGLWAGGRLAAFTGILPFPHPKVKDIMRCSRLVTLPDWQGLGLAFVLIERVAQAYRAAGKRLRCYPAHPSFVRQYAKNGAWRQEKELGTFSNSVSGPLSSALPGRKGRPCAVFEWCGPAMEDKGAAIALIEGAA